MLRSARTGIVLVVGLAAVLGAGTATAQTSNSNVAAEALFEDARSLVSAGKYAEACPKFAESQRLGPSVSTLLNLANCWEKLGRTATAWATYREAASAANAAGRKDYLATAMRHADGLSPKLARLTIAVAQPVNGLQVRRDGVAVASAEFGAGIPVDTGQHTVEASAPGFKPWSVTVDVQQDGMQSTATVPALEELPPDQQAAAAAPAAGSASSPAPAAATSTPENVERRSGAGQRIAGAVVAGFGVAGLAASLGVILAAKGKYNDSLAHCLPSDHNLCDATGLSQRSDARSMGSAATVLVGVGGALVVAGGIVFFTAPHAHSSAAALQVMPTLGGLVAKGAF